jgi:Reverse transcriptase (RNA-dependent DNA polymerase)
VSIWEDSGFIDKLQARKLRTYNGTISKMYGLPKIHKVGVPFRPIVSCINSPTYNLSRFYGDVINNVLYKTESFVRNSEEFKDFLLSIRIPEGYSIISLDVQSLFTSIDSESVIECVRSRWNHISHHTSLPLARFLEGLELILDNCFFVFDGITYHQIHGTPMGSPVSPVLAGLVMEELEISVLASLNFSPIFYKRYVDDIIVCLPTDEIDVFFNAFNDYTPSLNFTIEYQVDRTIPFLEVQIIQNFDGTISTDWYHKSTWSERYLNFNSHLPISYKRNTVSLLCKKVFRLSDQLFHEKNFGILRNLMASNGYPSMMVDDIIEIERRNYFGISLCPVRPIAVTKFIGIPYVASLFYKMKQYFRTFEIGLVGRSTNTLYGSIFTKLKDKTDTCLKSGIVYRINCSDCNQFYIGNTKQYLKRRVGQHKSAVNKNANYYSAIAEHALDNNHSIDWNNYQIVATDTRDKNREILEMIYIKKFKDSCVNRQVESEALTTTYDNIICS